MLSAGVCSLEARGCLHLYELFTFQNGFMSVTSFYSHFKPVRLGGQLLFSWPCINTETEHSKFVACLESTCLKQ